MKNTSNLRKILKGSIMNVVQIIMEKEFFLNKAIILNKSQMATSLQDRISSLESISKYST